MLRTRTYNIFIKGLVRLSIVIVKNTINANDADFKWRGPNSSKSDIPQARLIYLAKTSNVRFWRDSER